MLLCRKKAVLCQSCPVSKLSVCLSIYLSIHLSVYDCLCIYLPVSSPSDHPLPASQVVPNGIPQDHDAGAVCGRLHVGWNGVLSHLPLLAGGSGRKKRSLTFVVLVLIGLEMFPQSTITPIVAWFLSHYFSIISYHIHIHIHIISISMFFFSEIHICWMVFSPARQVMRFNFDVESRQ